MASAVKKNDLGVAKEVKRTYIQPTMTKSGITNAAICFEKNVEHKHDIAKIFMLLTIELPTHTPIVISILPLRAIKIAVTCSAALP